MQHLKPRYPLEEAFELLGLSRAVGYLRIKEGSLKTKVDGRRTFITADEVDRYAEQSHGPLDYSKGATQTASRQPT